MLSLFTSNIQGGSQSGQKVREPAVAGMFYPDDPQKLSESVEIYLSSTEKMVKGKVCGLVCPHAGYIYSGPVAAWAYKQIEGKQYPRVVVVAPSHFDYFPGASVFDGDFYETPLGRVPVARDYTEKLAEQSDLIQLSDAGHNLGFTGRGEHSLEVQLPFLQKVLGEFQLIPIIMGEQDWATCKALAQAIQTVFTDQPVLMVASSDLSHYHPYEAAYHLDGKLVDMFNNYEYRELLEQVHARKIEACGAGPIATVMFACQELGFPQSKLLKYATSGDVPYGEKEQVVGYMAGVLYQT